MGLRWKRRDGPEGIDDSLYLFGFGLVSLLCQYWYPLVCIINIINLEIMAKRKLTLSELNSNAIWNANSDEFSKALDQVKDHYGLLSLSFECGTELSAFGLLLGRFGLLLGRFGLLLLDFVLLLLDFVLLLLPSSSP